MEAPAAGGEPERITHRNAFVAYRTELELRVARIPTEALQLSSLSKF